MKDGGRNASGPAGGPATGAAAAGAAARPVKRGREFLHTPGPTNIPDRILNAMRRPALDFSVPEFIDVAQNCFDDIRPVFGTEGEVFILTSSGHGGWESAIVNLLEPGDRVLMPETGRFSRVWATMAENHGIAVEGLPNDWRHGIDPNAVEDRLRADDAGAIKAVLAVHVETASGAMSDMGAIRAAIDAAGHPALLLVDAIASIGTLAFPMDEWGVDVAICASQKGLMMPPGLAFVATSGKALEASAACRTHRDYWSWVQRRDTAYYRRFCGTAPEHLIFGLREALDMLAEEGLDRVFARHERLAGAARRAVDRWREGGVLDFNVVEPAQRAPALTVVRTPEGVDGDEIRRVAREAFGVAMGGGLADLGGRVFRIGHMGDLNEPMILGALGGIEAALRRCGIAFESGLADAAAWLADS